MKEQKLLLPLDVAKCPLEAFDIVNGLARRADTTVILLHVVTLNILAPETRVYEELQTEALSYLRRLAHLHLAAEATPRFRVRFGSAAEAILEEARAENVDLIILPAPAGSVWTRLTAFWKCQAERLFRPVARHVIQNATCGVFLLTTTGRFNCRKAWGRHDRANGAASRAEALRHKPSALGRSPEAEVIRVASPLKI